MAPYSNIISKPFSTGYVASREQEVTAATVIGIAIAITGNVLISLALNLQKLAHKRVDVDKQARAEERQPTTRQNGVRGGNGEAAGRGGEYLTEDSEDGEGPYTEEQPEARALVHSPVTRSTSVPILETQPLLSQDINEFPRSYGAGSASSNPPLKPNRTPTLRFASQSCFPRSRDSAEAPHTLLPVDAILEESASSRAVKGDLKAEENGSESDYLKSKLWWLGFALMNIGEAGNFISYGFAPASLVAPLGTFALLANCIFAPLMLGERFRKIDLLGIFIALVGAVTVVLSSNTSNSRLGPDALIRAISQRPFIIYSCAYVAGAVTLATLSEGQMGKSWVFVDVGLCALFGGFTVLSTKAISTLLTMKWIEMFTEWLTYPILFVLIFTGVSQVRYLNRALMHFDSKVVIPVQFVFFNLSAIVGSAILYGDFKKATFHQLVTFLYGCAATFAGVFIIAWAPVDVDEDGKAGGEVEQGADNANVATENRDRIVFVGTLGGRRRTPLSSPTSLRDTPISRRRSNVNLIGISPAQHLLMVHTPPRETSERNREWDVEHDIPRLPDSIRRRRANSWMREV